MDDLRWARSSARQSGGLQFSLRVWRPLAGDDIELEGRPVGRGFKSPPGPPHELKELLIGVLKI